MEFNYHLSQELESHFHIFDFEDFGEDDRFLDWMMEIRDSKFDRMTDDYLCLAMERGWRELNNNEAKLFHKLERMEDLWFEAGDPNWDLYRYDSDDRLFPGQYSYEFDTFIPLDDDCQLQGYTDFDYWRESYLTDLAEEQAKNKRKFCEEQELIRKIPLRGLKTSTRKELIREYCVH
ncbi:MAG: hypothetical protein KBB50_00735 [Candidatus Pacebacteria bacterium]|nr:hypothetical protein [Candidatus Paceibacterota bacterium]